MLSKHALARAESKFIFSWLGDDHLLTEAHCLALLYEGLSLRGALVDENDSRSHLKSASHLTLLKIDG